jgi:hypothetical protein
LLGEPVRVTVNASQSVPSTQVVSSVVAPAIPLLAQADEEPLTGPRVPEEGVEAEAGKTKAQSIATRDMILSLKFKRITLFGNNAELLGHTTASSF